MLENHVENMPIILLWNQIKSTCLNRGNNNNIVITNNNDLATVFECCYV